ncbi:MAG: sigma-70 family RNA polymerase sigma factor [Planctomycetota bacterium]
MPRSLELGELEERADRIRRLARALVQDPNEAEDLAQDAWLRSLTHGPRAEGSWPAWIAATLRNLARARWRSDRRRERREREVARPELQRPSSEALEGLDAFDSLVRAVRELDEPYRSAIVLRYLEGLTPREIAMRSATPVKTIETRLSRGLLKLRSKLDERGGGRGAWLAALLPLTRSQAITVTGLFAMNLKLKVLLAVFVALGLFLGVRELTGFSHAEVSEVASTLPTQEPATIPDLTVSEPAPRQQQKDPTNATPAKVRQALLSFVDPDQNALAGAQLALVEEGVERVVGKADERGVLALDAALVEDTDCVARAVDHASTLVRMPSKLETATIVMKPSGSISGTVRLADGSPPASTMCVVAHHEKAHILCAELTKSEADRSFRSALTDSVGFFTIAGLDPDQTYALSAAGEGYLVCDARPLSAGADPRSVADVQVKDVHPGARDVLLTALPMYGIRLVIKGDDDQVIPYRVSYSMSSFSAGCTDRTATDASSLLPLLVLAGIGNLDCAEAEGQDSFTFVYVSETEKLFVGPILAEINRPGYKHQTRSMMAPRLHGSIAEKVVELEPELTLRGAVQVEFDWDGPDMDVDVGVVLSTTDARSSLFLRVPRVSKTPFVVMGVPGGDYTCKVKICDGLLRISKAADGTPLQVAVLPDQTAVLKVDLAGQKIVNVSLRDKLGLSYAGPVILRVISQPSHVVNHISYDKSPYRIIGMKEGTYSIAAIRNGAGGTPVGEEEFQTTLVIGDPSVYELLLISRMQVKSPLR